MAVVRLMAVEKVIVFYGSGRVDGSGISDRFDPNGRVDGSGIRDSFKGSG